MPLPPLRLPSLAGTSLAAPTAMPSTLANFVPSPTSSPSGMGLGLNASGPRVLRHIDPSVTFMSRAPLAAHSCFKVSRLGAGHVHTERTELEMLSSSWMPMPQWPSEMECTFLYRTQFVPRFWETLCRAAGKLNYHYRTLARIYSPIRHPRSVGLLRRSGDRSLGRG